MLIPFSIHPHLLVKWFIKLGEKLTKSVLKVYINCCHYLSHENTKYKYKKGAYTNPIRNTAQIGRSVRPDKSRDMELFPKELLEKICTFLPFRDIKNLSEVSTSLARIRPDFTIWKLKANRRLKIHLKKIPDELLLELPDKAEVIIKKVKIKRAWDKSFADTYAISAMAGSPLSVYIEAFKNYGGPYQGRLITVEYKSSDHFNTGSGQVTVVHRIKN